MTNRAQRKHLALMGYINDALKMQGGIQVHQYNESGIYTIQVRMNNNRREPSIIGDVDEAIAFVRGVKAALEVL